MKKAIFEFFGLNKNKKRKIKNGPLKGMYFYGSYLDKRYFTDFEKDIVSKTEKIIKDGNIFDIGGHFGFYALLFSKLLNKGEVYTFEPNPYCYDQLIKNIKINNLEDKIKAFNFGISDQESSLEMMVVSDNLARSTCDQEMKEHYKEKKNIEMKNVTVKNLDNLGLPAPSLIKVDVEGMELEVVKGCYGSIKENLPDLIIEIHESHRDNSHYRVKELVSLLFNLGYSCYSIEENREVKENIPFSGHLHFYHEDSN